MPRPGATTRAVFFAAVIPDLHQPNRRAPAQAGAHHRPFRLEATGHEKGKRRRWAPACAGARRCKASRQQLLRSRDDRIAARQRQRRGLAQGNEAVVGGDALQPLVRSALGEGRHQRLALRPGDAAFVDDQDALRVADGGDELLLVDRAEPAQVDHACLHTIAGEQFLGLPREIISIAVSDDREVRACAMDADVAEADRRAFAGGFVDARPQPVAFFVEVARHVERDRFDEDDHALLLAREADAFAKHCHSVAPVRRYREDKARNVAENREAVVVVEMAAEALLIAEPRDADHHRVRILAVREEAQCRCLAADLVLGIVDIGEELDLGHRKEAIVRHADREPEDRLLVEQGVDDARRAETLMELRRDIVDATLRPDILARDDDLPMREHQVGERPREETRHVLRLVHRLRVAAEHRLAIVVRRRVGAGDLPLRRDQAFHHAGGGRDLRAQDRRFGLPRERRTDLFIGVGDLGARHPAMFDHQRRAREQRVARLVGLDQRLGKIGALHVGPGVAVEAHRRHMQEDGLARAPRMVGGFARAGIGRDEVGAVAFDIVEPRAVAELRLDPAGRGARRNADAIVFAKEDQRHGRALERRPARRVERALRGRMVRRRVAETRQHHRIVGQRQPGHAEPPRDPDRESRTDRLRQMRGDRRGLRRDRERLRPDHLVPSARDRIFGRGGEAQQHVPRRRAAGKLARPVELEGVRTIVEERHVGDAQRRGDRRIALVSRRADRVEAFAARLQMARQPVHLAARQLREEDVGRLRARQAGRGGIGRVGTAGQKAPREGREEFFMYRLRRVHLSLLSRGQWFPL
ncbi:protein of unknown function [uncultured Sphingopyxis sp.]|uniref:Uncharacterized protein n=1 Tax=uncultured Sphingopyxis sp. TaxID=310581 RepID=A0A1Y5Q248_9SPHN|nr:protein of unknown function [uncultured Sphingopyxis sp.]